ncbi:MAG: class I SAM-dependent RNA methyltransferase [Syntrophomonadaceae bacterium]|nr:class I SAM-dependent RNA methyltransferase [Syntrophomonadaceae bacterium]
MHLIGTCAFGLESVLGNELKKLGYPIIKTENGKITFEGDFLAIARCNLWLRSADRVLIRVGEFEARSFEQLFEQTRSLNWEDFLPEDACFPVDGKSVRSQLFSVSDCQAIVKKAIVEKLKSKYAIKWFKETGAHYRIQVSLLNDMTTLTIDTSGAGLHKRGYRQLSAEAPLKETLAAALVSISRWKPDRPFIDPFCGSGTIPIEAALIGRNIAPGLQRDFIAETWPDSPKKIWSTAREEAHSLMIPNQPLGIFGFDIDGSVLNMARHHAKLAGLGNSIYFQQQEFNKLRSKYKYGYLVTNPPYGERLGDQDEVKALYAWMPEVFARLDTWSLYILTAFPYLEKKMGRPASRRRKLYNGRLLCQYYQYFGPKPEVLAGPFSI